MRLRFFTIPVFAGESEAAELDGFLVSHRVLSIDRQLVEHGAASAWAICVGYVEGAAEASATAKKAPRIDYRELLSEADFRLYSKLRTLRKEIAEKDGVPVYAVFTNEQLALIVQRAVGTPTELQAIDGVGPARVEKYASRFFALLRAENANGSHAAT